MEQLHGNGHGPPKESVPQTATLPDRDRSKSFVKLRITVEKGVKDLLLEANGLAALVASLAALAGVLLFAFLVFLQ